jgi:hypothetical protein
MGRFQAWTLESRARYALVWGSINAITVSAVLVGGRLSDFSVGRALRYVALGLVIGVLAQGLIWYPRAKRKLANPPRVG